MLDTGGLPKCGADPWTRTDSFHFPIFQPLDHDDFESLEASWWQHLPVYESLYASGRIKGVRVTLLKTVIPLADDRKDHARGRILESIVTRSGEVTLLGWTGRLYTCHSCLPTGTGSPVYSHWRHLFVPSRLGRAALETRTQE